MREWTTIQLRTVESKVAKLFEDGKISGPIHLSGGNEVPLIKIFKDINPVDWVCSTHRYHYHYLLKGGTSKTLIHHLTNECTIHMFDKKLNFLTSAIVGGIIPIAVGIAKSLSLGGHEGRVYCFVGDGATDSGHFFEAVRYSINFKLPITFVVEDNRYSCDTRTHDRWGDDLMHILGTGNCVRSYEYNRIYPHTGMGKHITF